MSRAKKKKILLVSLASMFLLAPLGILLLDRGALRAQGVTPAEMIDAAEAMIQTAIEDPETRTEAIWLYEDALKNIKGDDQAARSLKARAHLGLALINLFDFFDLLPALSSFLGIDLLDLFSGLGGIIGGAGAGMAQPAALCTPIDFEDYLFTVEQMLKNMLTPFIYHAGMARQLDPNVTLMIDPPGIVEIAPDDPDTPEFDPMRLDLAGEWDATDAAFFEGFFQVLLGALQLLTSYDGIFQSLINPALTPTCTPATGSDDWTAIFGPYNQIVPEGYERMNAAGANLAGGFYAIRDSLELMTLETDDQSDDLVRFLDYGTDGLGPGDAGYPGPDADGTEGNGVYDLGEPWGNESIGVFLADLLGGFLGGGLPLDLGEMSTLLPPSVLAGTMDALGQSAEISTPVDLIPTLIKPLMGALGVGGLTDQDLYGLGLPAINLGAWFNPPIEDLSVLDALKDSNGTPIPDYEPAGTDTAHTWPDGSGRVDVPNGIPGEIYTFSMDVRDGQSVGVLGGLVLLPITDPGDFDGSGNLIGTVDFTPMMNPQYNAMLFTLGSLLP